MVAQPSIKSSCHSTGERVVGNGAATDTGKTPAFQAPVKGSILHASSPDAYEAQKGVIYDVIKVHVILVL